MSRVMVSVPTMDGMIKSACSQSLCNLDWGYDEVVYSHVTGYDCAAARTEMAKRAIAGGFGFILMIDSDMIVPPDALINLRECDANIAIGFAVRGSSDNGTTSVIPMGAGGYGGGYSIDDFARLRQDGCCKIEVKGGGLACALIRTDVFSRIAEPWFRFSQNPNGSYLGEDYWFCQQCRAAGMKIYADTRVGCGHIHDRVLEAL